MKSGAMVSASLAHRLHDEGLLFVPCVVSNRVEAFVGSMEAAGRMPAQIVPRSSAALSQPPNQ